MDDLLKHLFKRNSLDLSDSGTVTRLDGRTARLDVYHLKTIIEKTQLMGVSITAPILPGRWVLFILVPWGRCELRNVEDLRKSRRSGRKNQKTTFVHFAPGLNQWLFENRIQDFLDDPLAWT
jgi:hypothetical protein